MESFSNPTWLFAGMLVSTVGLGFFMYGKKEARIPHLVAGMAMMAYPGFVESPAAILAVGAALGGGLWLAVRAGA
tara:strand:+ start:14108 stop:14332 length:225 start_codon:yes stop_codon:yes gene_type:complete